MSDERLREAERKWKENGNVDDEARYLLERVRAGDLTQERLELAAYCGSQAAMKLVVTIDSRNMDPDAWVFGLERRSDMAFKRALTLYALQQARAWVMQHDLPAWDRAVSLVVSADPSVDVHQPSRELDEACQWCGFLVYTCAVNLAQLRALDNTSKGMPVATLMMAVADMIEECDTSGRPRHDRRPDARAVLERWAQDVALAS